eukprot:807626_1
MAITVYINNISHIIVIFILLQIQLTSSNCNNVISNILPCPSSEPTPQPTPRPTRIPTTAQPTFCPKPREFCTSAISRQFRCCNGHGGGTTRCDYNDIDTNGYQIGTCCVKGGQFGCRNNGDCCKSTDICINLICEPSMNMNGLYYLGRIDHEKVDENSFVNGNIVESGNTIFR